MTAVEYYETLREQADTEDITMSYSLYFCLSVMCLFVVTVGGREYCITENFSARCPLGQVIVVKEARFGRMSIGRCIKTDYGYLGCSKNVLKQLDVMCSGRSSCQFSISDPALVRSKPCPMDLSSYLEATFVCMTVVQVPEDECTAEGYRLPTPSGIMSSFQSSPCPVYVSLSPSQRLNITLLDFSGAASNTTSNTGGQTEGHVASRTQYCQEYALIEETGVGSRSSICGGGTRLRHVYLSRTNVVRIHLTSPPTAMFLLKYQAVGCEEPALPTGSHARYEDDVIFVFCNNSSPTSGSSLASMLTCVDGQWEGTLRNCTGAKSGKDSGETSTRDDHGKGQSNYGSLPPVGISVVIIFGVALVIVVYVGIMIVCVLFIKRRRRRRLGESSAIQGNKCRGNVVTDCVEDKVNGPAQAKSHSPVRAGLEERLPMLFKSNAACMQTGSVSEYSDFCELHDIKPASLVDLGPLCSATRTTSGNTVYDTATLQSRISSQGCQKTAQIDRTRLYESAHIIRSNDQDRGDARSHICIGDYGECLAPRNPPFTTGTSQSINPDLLPGERPSSQKPPFPQTPAAIR